MGDGVTLILTQNNINDNMKNFMVYLTERQHASLKKKGNRLGSSMGSIIRQALDKFLEDAVEVDVDALADGRDCIIAGIMEHIEEAGVQSGTVPVCCRLFLSGIACWKR